MHDGIGVEGSAPGNATIKTGLSHFLVVEGLQLYLLDGLLLGNLTWSMVNEITQVHHKKDRQHRLVVLSLGIYRWSKSGLIHL